MAIKSYPIGIHPDEHKSFSMKEGLLELPCPERVIVPLSQHIGRPAVPVVQTGETVKVGTLLASAADGVSAAVHSSLSGKITKIGSFSHPVLGAAPAVEITADGTDQQESLITRDAMTLSRDELLAIIRDAGIVGLGGAGFPTQIKLQPPRENTIDAFILNAVECEPYLTCDHTLMKNHAKQLVVATELIMKILGAKRGYIAVEANKMDAVGLFKEHLIGRRVQRLYADQSRLSIEILKVQYPHGAEKQLIKTVFGREVGPGKLPKDVGCIVDNVGTAFAVYEAATAGKPLYERIITVSGSGVARPCNVKARIGTLFSHVVDCCGGMQGDVKKIIMGGPLMGITQPGLDVPVIKGTTGILLFTEKETRFFERRPCIRCGRCLDVCPMFLSPTDIARFSEANDMERLRSYYPEDCIECGNCSYICPSRIPLVQLIRLGKQKVCKQADMAKND
ncbi:MAG: electron transport complex subunit RsxC [Candidatus Omnitrophica bacterium]|nr:electron transport complex subunit RsxC [Candidatus Omnitrophota bacterium]